MCLIAFAWQQHPEYPLIVAANRDEFFVRPARPARWWEHNGRPIFAGQDEQAGGTWMGVSADGRFAALTNHRDPASVRSNAPSRGALVPHFLAASGQTGDAFQELQQNARHFNGFNLIGFDGKTLGTLESREGRQAILPPGIYALSNASLDAPWPKQQRARAALSAALARAPDIEGLFGMLRCDRPAGDAALPVTGVGVQWERMLSSAFIRAPGYGTRCSSVVLFGADGQVRFEERTWSAVGADSGRVVETIQIQ